MDRCELKKYVLVCSIEYVRYSMPTVSVGGRADKRLLVGAPHIAAPSAYLSLNSMSTCVCVCVVCIVFGEVTAIPRVSLSTACET